MAGEPRALSIVLPIELARRDVKISREARACLAIDDLDRSSFIPTGRCFDFKPNRSSRLCTAITVPMPISSGGPGGRHAEYRRAARGPLSPSPSHDECRPTSLRTAVAVAGGEWCRVPAPVKPGRPSIVCRPIALVLSIVTSARDGSGFLSLTPIWTCGNNFAATALRLGASRALLEQAQSSGPRG